MKTYPPEPFRSRHADPYDGEIAYTDAQLGVLLEAIDSLHPGAPALIGGDLNTHSLGRTELGDRGLLKRALGMLVDGYSADEIRDILYTEMHYFRQRRAQHERFFRHVARLAPAFGVAGSVIGLIAMLSGIGDRNEPSG